MPDRGALDNVRRYWLLHLSKCKPPLNNPESIDLEGNPFTYTYTEAFLQLGAIAVIERDYREARRWFALVGRANVAALEKLVARFFPSFPRWVEAEVKGHPDKTHYPVEMIRDAAIGFSLVYSSPLERLLFVTEGIDWSKRVARMAVDELVARGPDKGLMAESNLASSILHSDASLPGLIVRAEGLQEEYERQRIRLDAWHERAFRGADMNLRGVWRWFYDEPLYRALFSGRPAEYVNALRKWTGSLAFSGAEAFKQRCEPRLLALHVEAWRRMPDVPFTGIDCIPENLVPSEYFQEEPPLQADRR